MKIEKVTVVHFSLPYDTLMSETVMMEYGVPVIATAAKNAGYDVQLLAEMVQPLDWGRILKSDAVCFHTFSCTVARLKEFSERLRRERPGVPIIVGGSHATVMVEDTLQYCDYVIRHEGDESLPELLNTLRDGGDVSKVMGISYWKDGVAVHNPNRPYVHDFNAIPDMELIPGYTKWKVGWKAKLTPPWKKRLVWNVLQTSRGCPWDCSFCIAPRDIGRMYRKRDIDAVIADIKYQRELTGTKRFWVVDNYFCADKKHTKKLLNRIIDEKLNWGAMVFTRIEAARDEELLRLMKRAGVVLLFIGLESFDTGVLALLNKGAPREGVSEELAAIRRAGLRVVGSFAFGSDADTVETIRSSIDSAIQLNVDMVSLFPLSAYPEKNSRLIPMNRFIYDDWARLDGGFVVFLPKNMKPSTLQKEINRAYRRFYSPRQLFRRLIKGDVRTFLWRLWYRWRVVRITRGNQDWIRHLESIEGEYYDEHEQLIEERLGEGLVPCQVPGTGRAADLEMNPMFVKGRKSTQVKYRPGYLEKIEVDRSDRLVAARSNGRAAPAPARSPVTPGRNEQRAGTSNGRTGSREAPDARAAAPAGEPGD